MFARVTTAQGKPEQLEAAIRTFKEQIGSTYKKMPGFKGSYFLVDRKSGKIMGIALWETEESLRAINEAATKIRGGVLQAAAATQPAAVEIYEVAAQF